MRLRSDIPPSIAERLENAGVRPEDVVLSASCDIDLLGRYGRQWVVATPRQLWVYSEKDTTEPRVTLTLDEADEFRTLAVVGSGLLQAKVDGIWVDLIRYSNRQKYWFGRLAKRLEQLRQGEPIELDTEDEHDPRRCPTCGLTLSFSGETCPRCIDRGAAIIRVLRLMKPYWPLATVMTVLLLIGISLDMIGPLLTKHLVDNVLKIEALQPAGGDEAAPSGRLRALVIIVGVLALVQILRATVSLFNGRVASRVGTAITYDIRGRLVAHLERLDLSYYDKQQVGSLVGRVAYDTEAVQSFMSQLTAGFVMQILMVVSSAILMFSLAPTLAIWTLIPAPFVFLGSLLFYRAVRPHYNRFYDRSSKQAGMLSGLLSGIRVVKAFAQERRELERFERSSGMLREARRRVDVSAATFSPIMGVLFQVGGWLVWYVGGGRVLSQGLSLGTLMAFFGYLAMFYGPLASLTNLTNWITQFSTQIHRIFEVLDTPAAVAESEEAVPVPDMQGRIEFRNVTFGYSRQIPVLKNLNLTIAPGQSLGVVGRSGSGKTTIVNLISRFYDVDEGQILIDNVDVRKISLNDLRRQVGVVLQEPFLFRGTIWANLVYGRYDTTEEYAIAACRAANAHDFILRQYHGYDTWVGERGAGLSGGERQRLSIARALLCDPKVLILDEATSSVDSESEMAIQRALAELIRDRTSIIIAHRLSTLRHCDKIIVVEEGRIIEEGTHQTLLALGGKYAKFVRLQTASIQATPVDALAAAARYATLQEVAPREEIEPSTGLSPVGSHRPRWLRPEIAKIHLGNLGALHVTVMNERIYHGVFPIRCMPVRHPNRFISLRYIDSEDRDQEVGLIRDLNEWPAESQRLIAEALLRRYFVHTIERIESIRQFQNFLAFSVQTDLRGMEFVLRYTQDSAQDYGERGKMLLDVDENRYLIPDVSALPESDRNLFERYIYW